jgi:hypothetical protein
MALMLGRFQDVIVKDDGTGIVASASITVRKRGAQVNATASANPIGVDHVGSLAASDTVIILEADGTIGSTTYNVDSVTESNETSGYQVNISGAAFSVENGDRLVVTDNLPTVYTDAKGAASGSNPITADANGAFDLWMEPGIYDLLISGTGVTTHIKKDYQVHPDRSSPGSLFIDATDARYGVKADGSTTTDGAALNEALADAAVIASAASTAPSGSVTDEGAIVIVPKGVMITNEQIVVPDRVTLRGQGARSSWIKCGTGFPTSTAVVQLGGTDGVAHDSRFEDCGIDCSDTNGTVVTGSIGMDMSYINENGGPRHFNIGNADAIGLQCVNATGQNFAVYDGDIICNGSAAIGMKINGSSSNNLVQNVTCNNLQASTGACFLVDGLTNVEFVNCHAENIGSPAATKIGIHFSSGTGLVRGFTGHNTLQDAVKIDMAGVGVIDINQGGSTNAINDTVTGGNGAFSMNSGGYYFHTNDGPANSKTILSSVGTNQHAGHLQRVNNVVHLRDEINLGDRVDIASATSVALTAKATYVQFTGSTQIDTITGGTTNQMIFITTDTTNITIGNGAGNITLNAAGNGTLRTGGLGILVYDGTNWQGTGLD